MQSYNVGDKVCFFGFLAVSIPPGLSLGCCTRFDPGLLLAVSYELSAPRLARRTERHSHFTSSVSPTSTSQAGVQLAMLGPLHAPSGKALPFSSSSVAINLLIDVQLDPMRSVRAGNQHSLFLHASGRVSALGSEPPTRRASCALFTPQRTCKLSVVGGTEATCRPARDYSRLARAHGESSAGKAPMKPLWGA
ncbi:hypothetical protein EDB92DRAFT_341935 [Lactarius akahatsu]|uniref:Uncharacterized protein n=1 Tax=Lactarius akahatsu TaxID=416441 RepID=A0AAD4LKC8_9AGAM|nr:hypothetical protein EDB92DRAFT_341935 [Lactarius akahatsu]